MNDEDADDVAGTGRRAASSAKKILRKRLAVSKVPYEVGYAQPPAESQFKPGQSGNPSGRPKGAKNKPSRESEKIKNMFSKIAGQKITIRKGDKTAQMSKMDYILNSAIDKAAKGHAGMTKLVIGMALNAEKNDEKLHAQRLQEAIEYKNYWTDLLQFRKSKGIFGEPDPIPHPDDVLIDRHGNVTIVGPITPEEKKEHDEIEAKRDAWKAEWSQLDAKLKSLMGELKDRRRNPDRVREELFKACEDLDAVQTLLKATSREVRHCSKLPQGRKSRR